MTTAEESHKQRQQVLIFKLGYTETLDNDVGGVVSLGDVLRTTVILHLFPPSLFDVTWVVDPKAAPLLRDNAYISRVVSANAFTTHQLMTEWYDIVINFEKDPGVCAMADRIPAWKRYGFRYDPVSGRAVPYEFADIALSMSEDASYKKSMTRSWSEVLYQMLGKEYRGESYILGERPKKKEQKEQYDVGLNHLIGKKYPLKRWPQENWEKLFDQLSPQYSVSWQEGENSLNDYIDWIDGCRLVVTNDSLGLHLALALGKKVVALFGPTIPSEIEDGPQIRKITPEVNWDCIPCLESKCQQEVICMTKISLAPVTLAVNELLA